MDPDRCVECSRKVTTRQHAVQCDMCNLWQHRICNTGITQTDYREMVRNGTLAFTCSKCKEAQEVTMSGPAESTHISDQPTPELGCFSLSISSMSDLNATYVVQRPQLPPRSPIPPPRSPTPPPPQPDFEKGAWKAIRQEFPETTIHGCAFHFCQAIFRKVTDLGLKTTYSQRGAEYRYIRSLMALPFLPTADIPAAFAQLGPRATSPELQRLVDYIAVTWINNPVYTPRTWSTYQRSIRTNNDVEGWHTRINADVDKENAPFYILVPALQREANLVELAVRLVSEEQILRNQRQRYKELEGRLHEVWGRYEDDEISASQLLRECGQIYGPNND